MTDNGYVRLTYAAAQKICLVHLISGLDEDRPDSAASGAMPTAITGYTEWISEGSPVLTVGWDWQMLSGVQGIQLHRASEPRSNVMFQTATLADAGQHHTSVLLETLIDGFDWQSQTLQHINTRYRN